MTDIPIAIDKLLISPPGRPDDSSWSAEAHRIDDTRNRAAHHGLMREFHEREAKDHRQKRAACIADAEAQEASTGLQTPFASVEQKVAMVEDTVRGYSRPPATT